MSSLLRKLRGSLPGAMPRSSFISHSYDDAAIVEELKSRLPAYAGWFIFPPIRVPPDQRVSDDLVRAILDHPGLIHVESPNSQASFWVTFERDFALRNKREVYAYEPASGRFRRDTSRPLNLRVFPTYAREDERRIAEILTFMAKQRHFVLPFDKDIIRPGEDIAARIDDDITGTLEAGGYTVAFLSQSMLRSRWVERELQRTEQLATGRILPALLEPIELSKFGPHLASLKPVRLYRQDVAYPALNQHAVDDLIVRIYAMVHKNRSAAGLA